MLHLDTGNTGFMILCTSLVMLMTPGLAFFYGGLVGRKNVLAIMIQSFVSMGWTTVIWYLYGYSLCFSGDWHGVIGNFHNAFLRGINLEHALAERHHSALVFIAYQMMFAIITPALISGAFTNRVTFKAYMLFLTGMADLRVLPVRSHGVGRRIPPAMGREGLCRRHRGPQHRRHRGPGFGALRGQAPRAGSRTAQHSAGRAGHGTAVVWVVRFQRWQRNARGFGHRTAFLNTDIAASFAAVAWLVVAWLNEKKPKFLGLLTGAVAGLATVTPAAGYVSPTTAVIIGIVSGVVCYYAVEMKNKLHWDDALDVWGVHGVGGFLGIVMLGIFANKQFNPEGANGLLYGDPIFLLKQVTAVAFSSVWAFIFTYAMLRIIDAFIPVKVSEASEEIGLDESLHGEHAYEQLTDEDVIHKLVESVRN